MKLNKKSISFFALGTFIVVTLLNTDTDRVVKSCKEGFQAGYSAAAK